MPELTVECVSYRYDKFGRVADDPEDHALPGFLACRLEGAREGAAFAVSRERVDQAKRVYETFRRIARAELAKACFVEDRARGKCYVALCSLRSMGGYEGQNLDVFRSVKGLADQYHEGVSGGRLFVEAEFDVSLEQQKYE